MILKMAVRNVKRNKRADIIIGIIITIGLFCAMTGLSFIQGIKENYQMLAIGTIAGHIDISPERDHLVYKDSTLDKIQEIDTVSTIAPRIVSSVYISTDDNYIVCTAIGIDQYKDKQLVENFSTSRNPLIISDTVSVAVSAYVAKELDISEGETINISVINSDNEVEKKSLVVSSIYEGKATNSAIKSWIIADINMLRVLLGFKENQVSCLKVFTNDDVDNLDDTKERIINILNEEKYDNVKVNSWYETVAADFMRTPAIYSMILMMCSGILFSLIFIGISSVLYSSIMGRVREFGVLQAIGMSRYRIMLVYSLEIIIIVICSSIAALLLNLGTITIVNNLEITTNSEALIFTFGGRVLRLSFSLLYSSISVVIVILLSCLTSIISVAKVTRIKIIEAVNF